MGASKLLTACIVHVLPLKDHKKILRIIMGYKGFYPYMSKLFVIIEDNS